ncbi:hypothetical protein EYZ11_011933 [Aspergillus tanneri]|uniref:FAD dependent oxidoreductase domain-containing protein n=1 Tax=Aspergillus tanneri TaxID=1220188 RepID=A0A4S3J6W3_9EURO|nr:hypothetical protein EYZ11_011933 [Aspergillus tanneri]
MSSRETYDVAVIGGGPIGLCAAYEVAKSGRSVVVLEQSNFFNQAGSSNDLARMFRTMYTEDYMADLAYAAMSLWDELESDAGDDNLRLMTGLLNFGDPNYGEGGPEGTLMGPVKNLDRLNMSYKKRIFAPDNGIINVPLLVRTLYRLAQDYGAKLQQYTKVTKLEPDSEGWSVTVSRPVVYHVQKLIITSGAYVNHVIRPSFDIQLRLDIWEMVASYFSVNAGPRGRIFPSMWFQFQDDIGGRSQLFYGFPALPWGPPNVARIAVDAATRRISDPDERETNVVNPSDIANTQSYIQKNIAGVDSVCADNMFVMDFIPEEHLKGGAAKSVVLFTAGWGMKFVPLIGRALRELALGGQSEYARPEFSITRKDPKTGEGLIDKAGSQPTTPGPGQSACPRKPPSNIGLM